MSTVAKKLKYLRETKRLIKEKIQSFVDMPDETPFRQYPNFIGGGAGGVGDMPIVGTKTTVTYKPFDCKVKLTSPNNTILKVLVSKPIHFYACTETEPQQIITTIMKEV